MTPPPGTGAVGPGREDVRARPPRPRRRDRRAVRVVSSSLTLVVIGLAVGLLVALVVGGGLWALTTALHHAAND